MDLQMNAKLPLHGGESGWGVISLLDITYLHIYMKTVFTAISYLQLTKLGSSSCRIRQLGRYLLTVQDCPVTYTCSLPTFLFTQA